MKEKSENYCKNNHNMLMCVYTHQ